jgi:hypothetical protein
MELPTKPNTSQWLIISLFGFLSGHFPFNSKCIGRKDWPNQIWLATHFAKTMPKIAPSLGILIVDEHLTVRRLRIIISVRPAAIRLCQTSGRRGSMMLFTNVKHECNIDRLIDVYFLQKY